MSDNNNYAGTGVIGLILTVFGWVTGFIGLVSLSAVPIILSSIASLMAIVNYYYQIKKTKSNGYTKFRPQSNRQGDT